MTTRAQESLLKIFSICGPFFNLRTIRYHGLMDDYRRAHAAGYFRTCIETTSKAGDFLDTEAGRAALADEG